MEKPEKKFSTGALQATVWKNKSQIEGEEYKTISFTRRYKDKKGEWKSTNSLRINDLPKAIVVLKRAFEYLVLKEDIAEEAIEGA